MAWLRRGPAAAASVGVICLYKAQVRCAPFKPYLGPYVGPYLSVYRSPYLGPYLGPPSLVRCPVSLQPLSLQSVSCTLA